MDTTKDDYSGVPDIPQNTPPITAEQDRRRAFWILLAVVIAALVIGGLIGLFTSSEDASLQQSSTAGAQVPANLFSPARVPEPK